MRQSRRYAGDIIGNLYLSPAKHHIFASAEVKQPIYAAAKRLGVRFRGKTVLEVGAGTGTNTPLIRGTGARQITALEPFSRQVGLARGVGNSEVRVGKMQWVKRTVGSNKPTVTVGNRRTILPQHDVVLSTWSFDPMIMSLMASRWGKSRGLKEYTQRAREAAFGTINELARNVKPGGSLIVYEYIPNRVSRHSQSEVFRKAKLDAISDLEAQGFTVIRKHDFMTPFRAEGKHARQLMPIIETLPGVFKPEELDTIRRQFRTAGRINIMRRYDLFVIRKPDKLTPRVSRA